MDVGPLLVMLCVGTHHKAWLLAQAVLLPGHGRADGLTCCLLQIAKAQGAFVATTCSTRNVEFVTQVLGADQAIDYTTEK